MREPLEQACTQLVEELTKAGLFRLLQGRSREIALDCLKLGFWAGVAAREVIDIERDAGGVAAAGGGAD